MQNWVATANDLCVTQQGEKYWAMENSVGIGFRFQVFPGINLIQATGFGASLFYRRTLPHDGIIHRKSSGKITKATLDADPQILLKVGVEYKFK